MNNFTKTLSIIIFKRFFDKYPFIIFIPKICLLKSNFKNNHLKKYILKYFNNLNFFNYNISNLSYFYFDSKIIFLNMFYKYYLKIYSIKYKNILIYSTFFKKKNLYFFNSKTFFFKLKFFFNFILKYIYSFLRYLKKL